MDEPTLVPKERILKGQIPAPSAECVPPKTHEELNPDKIELLKRRIGGWLRQNRYRARKSNIEADVELQEVIDIYEQHQYRCAYCSAVAGSPEQPFPLKEQGPCLPANILPCCDKCRNLKKGQNLIAFYQEGHLSESELHAIIRQMVSRRGGSTLRAYIKQVVGAR